MNFELLNPTPEYFGHKIRVLIDTINDNAPWFVAADVCKTLGLNSNTSNHLRKLDQRDVLDVKVNSINIIKWRGRAPKLVSEPGFYELVLGSRKPGAIAFKRWVCSEVLPSIRRTGQYQAMADASNTPLDVPEVMVDLVRTIPGVTKIMADGTVQELARRMHVYEYLEIIDAEGLTKQQRAALGKIARRLLHTHNLPIIKTWRPYNDARRWKDIQPAITGTYPEKILDMAYKEFINGKID